eukprot:CAMPEP_0116126388 /NCGR_PEP_ID=MMETSP0329-20121206/6307_1 /TAXON_ID=697910 /ORGANISM="Pseudo-nitzschia arenysensis, Strain B593" /LENGTH=309 /DNA_ID=CAMNT_0003620471 /DNA_START=32 /DNA_END=961 /DNA_ORIENTATION=-
MPIYTAEDYHKRYGDSKEKHPLPTDCESSNYPRLIHGEETWKFLQKVFYERGYARRSYHHKILHRRDQAWYSGIDDNYVEARNDEDGRGRGLYAKTDIPKGTKLWFDSLDWVANDGSWDSKEKMMDFLGHLPHDLQCDVTLWAYATTLRRKNRGDKQIVACNLDEASYFNHAEQPEMVNIISQSSSAMRDIEKGEELLMDYGSFISLGNESLTWWNEIRSTAWQEAVSSTNSSSSFDSTPSNDAMDGYVKYGAPKVVQTKMTGGTVFADAYTIHGAQATSYDLFSTLAGASLALVLIRGLAMTGLRRRR